MNHKDKTSQKNPNECREPPMMMTARRAALQQLDERLVVLLGEYGVSVEPIDNPYVVCFRAVPLEHFSKPRTNLLLRRLSPVGGSSAYVDADLEYTGSDKTLMETMTGRTARNWRQLRVPPMSGPTGDVFCDVLELLGSPIAGQIRSAQTALDEGGKGADTPSLGRMLDAIGEIISPEEAAEAHRTSFRKELATRLAIITTRSVPPFSAVLWGRSGSGLDHLMLAAAHVLFEGGHRSLVVRVCSGRAAAGSIFQAEADTALLKLLSEAGALEDCLLLLQDLDVCVTGSPASRSLLCNALDHGLRLFATVKSEAGLARFEEDEALARRLAPVRVDAPTYKAVAEALRELGKASRVEVAPAAIQAVLSRTRKQGAVEPAASISLLSAAIAEVAWRGGKTVHPDDVLAVPCDEWPGDNEKE